MDYDERDAHTFFPIGKLMMPDDVGAAVRSARRAQGLTQKELAMAARTGTRFVGELERGKETCRLGETLRVLAALGLDVRLEPRGR